VNGRAVRSRSGLTAIWGNDPYDQQVVRDLFARHGVTASTPLSPDLPTHLSLSKNAALIRAKFKASPDLARSHLGGL
jgi:hypothetical protein